MGDQPKVMFYNAQKGAPLPGTRNMISQTDMSFPVEVLFNENSSVGEVRPLRSGTVDGLDSESGLSAGMKFEEGENIVLGHNQLSARPNFLDGKTYREYKVFRVMRWLIGFPVTMIHKSLIIHAVIFRKYALKWMRLILVVRVIPRLLLRPGCRLLSC